LNDFQGVYYENFNRGVGKITAFLIVGAVFGGVMVMYSNSQFEKPAADTPREETPFDVRIRMNRRRTGMSKKNSP